MAGNITEILISNGSISGIDTIDNLNATVPSDSFYPSSKVILVVKLLSTICKPKPLQWFLSNAMARCLTIEKNYTIIARQMTSISRPKGNISSKDMIDNWHTKGPLMMGLSEKVRSSSPAISPPGTYVAGAP